MRVTVYTTGPACMQCTFTLRRLAQRGIPFTLVDLSEDENQAARVYVTEELGYSQAPVVEVDDQPGHHWCGFRTDKIDQLTKRAILPSDATREARSPAR